MMDEPSVKKYSFGKHERLKNRKLIRELFQKGSSFFIYPFKTLYLPDSLPAGEPHKILVSVPRKNFKKAVDRNKVKRRVREAYRLNKHMLNTSEHTPLAVAFIYVSKEIMPFKEIENKLKSLLLRLKKV